MKLDGSVVNHLGYVTWEAYYTVPAVHKALEAGRLISKPAREGGRPPADG